MKITPTSLPEVLLIDPDVYTDSRGYFQEIWSREKYSALGCNAEFVQDNQSRSYQGVLRGLHYQLEKPQGKLVKVMSGKVFDVAVDIRKGSPTFKHWVSVELSEDNHRQLYIPPGFAHGFCVLSEQADFFYKCTDFYDSSDERGIFWNDPDIGITWPEMEFVVSEKDSENPALADSAKYLPHYQVSP